MTVRKNRRRFLVIACLLLLSGLLWYLALSILHWVDLQSSNVRTSIIGAAALVAVPIVTYWTTKSIEYRRSTEQSIRTKKLELYLEIFTLLMRIFEAEIPGKPKPDQEEIARFISDTKPKLLALASSEVCERWGVFWSRDPAISSEWENAVAMEGLIKVIRKDVGHSSIGLSDGDLARIYINDVSKYRPADWNKRRLPYFVQWFLSKID